MRVTNSRCCLPPSSGSRRRETATLGCPPMFRRMASARAGKAGEGPNLGQLVVRCFGRLGVAGDHMLDLIFAQVLSAHNSLLSLGLAERIKITDAPSVPSAAKTTATVPPTRRLIAISACFCRNHNRRQKEGLAQIGEVQTLLSMVCRFGASHVIISMGSGIC